MANLKSAIKRVNTNNKKRERNQSIKSDMRTHIKQVEKFVSASEVDNAKAAYQNTVRVIDKAVQKGVIHQNNGNRHKANLAKKVNHLGA
jgi:small subunit ribosomal protein S20